MSKSQSLELPSKLLTAWRDQDISAFKQFLAEGCDVNHLYKEDLYQPILGVIARAHHQNGKRFAEAVLTRAIDIDKQYMSGKCAIHHAVEVGNLPVLEALVSANADVNSADQLGCTALHTAVMQNWNKNLPHKQCMQLLMEHQKVNLNAINRKGLTPVHVAANKKNREAVLILLEKGSLLDLDSTNSMGITPRGAIIQYFPDLEPELPQPLRPEVIKMDGSKLFHLLHDGEQERFCTALKKEIQDKSQKGLITYDNGKYTLLQYACVEQLTSSVETLLSCGADPYYSTYFNKEKPTEIAARRGFHDELELLLKASQNFPAPSTSDESLHLATKYGHTKCVQLLLDKKWGKSRNWDVNARDILGNTPLHYAVLYGNDEIVSELLNNGSYLAVENKEHETPLPKIPYSILKNFLDEQITHLALKQNNPDEKFIFNYSFLRPPNGDLGEPTERDRLKGNKQGSSKFEQETKPLLIMSKSADLRPLLKHPVLTSFTLLKWQRIQVFFYINLLFYLTLCLFLTGYIIFAYRTPHHLEEISENTIVVPEKVGYHDKTNFTDLKPQKSLNQDSFIYSSTSFIVRAIILILLTLLFIRELFQLILKPRGYLKNYENYVEVLILCLATFVTVNNCSYVSNDSTYLKYLCPQLSALVILIAWFELVLLLGKHPLFSVQIEMFRKVSFSFLHFLSWYVLLILSFALCFYVLFRGCDEACSSTNPFLNPLESIFKTLIMLTGEFESGDIPFLSYIGVSHVIFIAFVFLIAIVLLNLLNGLAVADTKVIKDDAYYYSCIARVKLISFIENILLGENQSNIQNFYNFCDTNLKCSVFSYFARKIVFFPSFLPDAKIEINVKENSIKCLDQDGSSIKQSIFYIDNQTIRDARDIAEERGERKKISDTSDSVAPRVETCLSKIDDLAAKLRDFERRFEAIEQANKQIEELLIRNIAIVSLNNANNEDR